jgi:hypothetical protein
VSLAQQFLAAGVVTLSALVLMVLHAVFEREVIDRLPGRKMADARMR